MKSTNTVLTELQESVALARDGAQTRADEAAEQADFADVFIAASAQSQLEWLDSKAQEAPLTFTELQAEAVAPHLLARVAASNTQVSNETFDVRVLFGGEPVSGHAIEINFFGQFLHSLQNTFNALVQWRTYNASAYGRVQQSIIDNNRLLLAATFTGSFGAGLRIVSNAQEQDENTGNLSLFDDIESDSASDALPEELLLLLQQLLDGNASKASLIEALTQPRVKTHYQKMIELVVKRGADIRFSTRTYPEPVRISTQQARARLLWLENLQTKEDVQSLEGTLVGGSIERNRFELKQSDELIEGRMTSDAADSFRRLSWGDQVLAVVRVTTLANDETATEKTAYQLLGISLATENLLRATDAAN